MRNESLAIGLTGDVMIGRGVDLAISGKDYLHIWGNVLPLLRGTDVNIINLETSLTTSNRKVLKTFNFRAAPDRVRSLAGAGVSIANLANNHVLDFSEEGLTETIRTLKSAGIRIVGAGNNDKEAARPAIIKSKNISIGVIGLTDNEPAWAARSSSCGINYVDIAKSADRSKALYSIRQLRNHVDIVIVSIHWGPNMQEEPSMEFVAFAHEMIGAGADIIHGHSAHIFQGIEVYHEKLILYDTGDFVDDYMVDRELRNDHSFFFRVEAGKRGVNRLDLIPVLISGSCVNLATGEDYKWSLQRMQALSAKFGTEVNGRGEVCLQSIKV